MNGPNEWGMKRGAWKRTVEAALWYTQRPIARARLPGRNSEVGYVFNTLKVQQGDSRTWKRET